MAALGRLKPLTTGRTQGHPRPILLFCQSGAFHFGFSSVLSFWKASRGYSCHFLPLRHPGPQALQPVLHRYTELLRAEAAMGTLPSLQ